MVPVQRGNSLEIPADGEPLGANNLVRVDVNAALGFDDIEVGRKYRIGIKLRGKDEDGSFKELYTFHFRRDFMLGKHKAHIYLPYEDYHVEKTNGLYERSAIVRAELLDEDPDTINPHPYDKYGNLVKNLFIAQQDEITAVITITQYKAFGSLEAESPPEVILVETHG
jgi:hypothetical protein